MAGCARVRRLLADLSHDLRQGMRSLRVRPGPTALAVLTPAVAIAAAMYTVLRAVLLRDLPGARKPS